ncbi:hypothetical protein NCC49_000646 [Naganishia albida]|nr:hypothetical protein NCC49_000646 [Naganishia albida]
MAFYSSSRPASPPPIPTSQPLPAQKTVPQHATFAARQQKHVPPGTPVPIVVGSHSKTVRSVAWSCNGQTVASGSDDKNVKIWARRTMGPNAFELAHPEPLLPHPTILHPKPTTTSANPITNLSFSPRRVDILAVASNDGSGSSPAGKVVAVQGPGSTSYDKQAEEAFLKEIEEGMKGKGRKAEPPKVEIWNISKRQIITTIHLAHPAVFLAFHPSAKQLAIVCFDSRERNDYVVFAWQPEAVEVEGDLAFEDADAGAEKAKREQEREAYRALLERQRVGTESAQEEGWQIRTDIRLGEKNYRVSELNGAMFGPCGTRMYAGNHDGRLNVWDYPIKRVVPEVSKNEKMQERQAEGPAGEEEKQPDTEENQDDDEDAPMRRTNESRQTPDPTDGDKPQPTMEEDTPMETEETTVNGEEEKTLDKEDGETSSAPDAADKSSDVGPPIQADEDIKMKDIERPSEEAKPSVEGKPKDEANLNDEVKPVEEEKPTAEPKPDQPADKADVDAQPELATTTAATTGPPPAPAPLPPPAQMLKYLYGQVVNSGCLNCIDIDPRRRYIATGGSEGMVSLCEVGEWIGVAAFDSYTEEVKNVKFSWDGEYIAAAGDDRCIDIMSTATGTTLHRIPTRGTVASLAWSPARHTLCFATQGQGSSSEWYYVQM